MAMSVGTLLGQLRLDNDHYLRGLRNTETATRASARNSAGEVEKSSKRVEAARSKEEDAAGKVRVEESKLEDLRQRSNVTSDRLTQAEERLAKARRDYAIATRDSHRAVEDQSRAVGRLNEALTAAARPRTAKVNVDLDTRAVEQARLAVDRAAAARTATINAQADRAAAAAAGRTLDEAARARQARIDAAVRGEQEANARLAEVARDRLSRVNVNAETAAAEGALNFVARNRASSVDAQAQTAAAEGALNFTARNRGTTIAANADVFAAEGSLNFTARNRGTTIAANADTFAAEGALNFTARNRPSTINAHADVLGAETSLNFTARNRTSTIAANADVFAAEAALNFTARNRSTVMNASADTLAAEAQLNFTARARQAVINAHVDGASAAAADAHINWVARNRSSTINVDADTGMAHLKIGLVNAQLVATQVQAAIAGATTTAAFSGMAVAAVVVAAAVFGIIIAVSILAAGIFAAGAAAAVFAVAAIGAFKQAEKQAGGFQDALNRIKVAWDEAIRAMAPHILALVDRTVGLITGGLKAMEPIVAGVSAVFGSWLDKIKTSMETGSVKRFFDWIERDGVRFLGILGEAAGRVFGSITTTLENLTGPAGPAERLFRWVVRVIDEFIRWIGTANDNRTALGKLVESVERGMPGVNKMFGDTRSILDNVANALRVIVETLNAMIDVGNKAADVLNGLASGPSSGTAPGLGGSRPGLAGILSGAPGPPPGAGPRGPGPVRISRGTATGRFGLGAGQYLFKQYANDTQVGAQPYNTRRTTVIGGKNAGMTSFRSLTTGKQVGAAWPAPRTARGGVISINSEVDAYGNKVSDDDYGGNTEAERQALGERLYSSSGSGRVGHRPNALGNILTYAAGGWRDQAKAEGLRPMSGSAAKVVPPNTWRVIGGRPRSDEAFIPINRSNRSQSLLAMTAQNMGFGLSKMASGGIMPVTEDSPIATKATPNQMRVVGDRSTGREAFIPVDGSRRSASVLDSTARKMGFSLTAMAKGGLLGDEAASAAGGKAAAAASGGGGLPIDPEAIKLLQAALQQLKESLDAVGISLDTSNMSFQGLNTTLGTMNATLSGSGLEWTNFGAAVGAAATAMQGHLAAMSTGMNTAGTASSLATSGMSGQWSGLGGTVGAVSAGMGAQMGGVALNAGGMALGVGGAANATAANWGGLAGAVGLGAGSMQGSMAGVAGTAGGMALGFGGATGNMAANWGGLGAALAGGSAFMQGAMAGVAGASGLMAGGFGAATNAMGGSWNGFVGALLGGAGAAQAAMPPVAGAAGGMAAGFGGATGAMGGAWNGFVGGFQGGAGAVQGAMPPVVGSANAMAGGFNAATAGMGGGWGAFVADFTGRANDMAARMGGFNNDAGAMGAHWAATSRGMTDTWNGHSGAFHGTTDAITGRIGGLNNDVGGMGGHFGATTDFMGSRWQGFSDHFEGQRVRGSNNIGIFGADFGNLGTHWGVTSNNMGGAWQGFGDHVRGVFDGRVAPTFNDLRNLLGETEQSFGITVGNIARIWDGIKPATAKPVNFMISEVYNKGVVGAWNKVAVDFLKQPALAGHANIAENAKGGIIPGYTPGRDTQLSWVSGGEAIMRPEWTRAMGPGYINAANEAARQGGVRGVQRMNPGGGGGYGSSTGGRSPKYMRMEDPGFPAVTPDVADGLGRIPSNLPLPAFRFGGYGQVAPHVAAAGDEIQKLFGEFEVGGFRAGPPDHGTGHALDFMTYADKGKGDRIVDHLMKNSARMGVKYLIWQQKINDQRNGKGWEQMEDRGSITQNHFDHVHASFTGDGRSGPMGGGMAGGMPAFDPKEMVRRWWVEENTKGFMGTARELPGKHGDNLFSKAVGEPLAKKKQEIGIPWVEHHADAIVPHIMPWIMSQMGGMHGMGVANTMPVENWRPLVEMALRYLRLPLEWANVTLNQIRTESGGNPNAVNNWDSNAARGTPSGGLLQTIAPTFAANRDPALANNMFDPFANIVASMRYAMRRYGSLPAAYRGVGYDSGGWLEPGMTHSANDTGKPEAVLTSEQWRAVMSGGLKTEKHYHLTVYTTSRETNVREQFRRMEIMDGI